MSESLHVMTAFSNPCGWKSRVRLYDEFDEMVTRTQGAWLHPSEMSYGDCPHVVTVGYPEFRAASVLWHKENLLNLALANLPRDAEYVAWIDADVSFIRPDWAAATVAALQKHTVVQMWSHAVDYGPDFQPLSTCRSLMASVLNSGVAGPSYALPVAPVSRDMHTGYAWAARREWLDAVKFGDAAIVGGGDRHMAYAMLGDVESTFTPGVCAPYRDYCRDYWANWQCKVWGLADGWPKVGCVPGTINHYWHGAKQDRGYQTRSNILAKHAFDPYTDLTYTTGGVLEFTEHGKRMQNDILAYFQSRNEDSTEVVNPFQQRMAAPGIFAGEAVVA
jgi:hypothetical protein